jgi:hypothetical protein
MRVRVCGPNLNDQSKGTFHVHADGCADLKKYGPYRKYSGEVNGEAEMPVDDATVLRVVCWTYADQINEQPEDERAQYVDNLVNDFWFAPCTDGLPFGDRRQGCDDDPPYDVEDAVWECWIAGGNVGGSKADSFAKFDSEADVVVWLTEQLGYAKVGDHIHIVLHNASEYS